MSDTLYSGAVSEVTLLRVRYGTREILVCDGNSPVPFQGGLYLADSNLEFEISEATGGLDDEASKIRGDLNSPVTVWADFLRGCSSSDPWGATSIEVIEVLVSKDTGVPVEPRWLFVGRVRTATRNAEDLKGKVELLCDWEKSTFDETFGIQTNAECGNRYGGRGCGLAISAYPNGNGFQEWHNVRLLFGTGTSVYANANSGDPTEQAAITFALFEKWSRGFLLDPETGSRLLIKQHVVNSNRLVLVSSPPASWEYSVSNKVLQLWPGCKKDKGACGIRGNLANFNGLGLATPAYNPIAEEDNR